LLFKKLNLNEFDSLKAIMEEDALSPLTMWISMGRVFMRSEVSDTTLMLRVNDTTLTIAQIEFSNRRNGYGTRVLDWLKHYAKQNGQTIIKIESANTHMIVNFAKKHGFTRKEDSYDWYLDSFNGNLT